MADPGEVAGESRLYLRSDPDYAAEDLARQYTAGLFLIFPLDTLADPTNTESVQHKLVLLAQVVGVHDCAKGVSGVRVASDAPGFMPQYTLAMPTARADGTVVLIPLFRAWRGHRCTSTFPPRLQTCRLECQSHDGPDGPVQPVTRITPIRDSGYELGLSGITKDQDQFLQEGLLGSCEAISLTLGRIRMSRIC
jgi:hypothetical protein